MRLNKYLSESGVASRRKADELIGQRRVTVNNNIITILGLQVDPEKDDIRVDGEKIKPEKKIYYLLNKPKGYVTTTSDEKGRKTVLDLVRTNTKIFPCGRLDYNTTGVLILTNDGEFANFIMHPSNKIRREYLTKLSAPLLREHKIRFEKGIVLDGRRSYFSDITFPVQNNYRWVKVTTVEGRNHFVKRMFKALGYSVQELKRVSYGTFNADNMKTGQSRIIDKKEITEFMKAYSN
ncbi:MAG: rRNA pseudouridine synthase [Melioribacteraceae bacterium]|nr:rRNA pseudouridine synthase [Melioribacteraceae bacterium]